MTRKTDPLVGLVVEVAVRTSRWARWQLRNAAASLGFGRSPWRGL